MAGLKYILESGFSELKRALSKMEFIPLISQKTPELKSIVLLDQDDQGAALSWLGFRAADTFAHCARTAVVVHSASDNVSPRSDCTWLAGLLRLIGKFVLVIAMALESSR